jgi:hypothetical protein
MAIVRRTACNDDIATRSTRLFVYGLICLTGEAINLHNIDQFILFIVTFNFELLFAQMLAF